VCKGNEVLQQKQFRREKTSRGQSGVGMIEVLVAMAVMAVGILAVAGAQANGLRASHGAHYRAQASFIAQDMIERMRGNPGQARNYAIDFGDAVPDGTSIAHRDRAQWRDLVALLPAGAGAVEVDELSNLVRVTVRWDNSRSGGADDEAFTLTSRIWGN